MCAANMRRMQDNDDAFEATNWNDENATRFHDDSILNLHHDGQADVDDR